ncbi:MAG: hypothetical protein K8S87_10295 [Planctomycetes bacterium]|nr:hypothetical protein [Planctomycetota bacterium]
MLEHISQAEAEQIISLAKELTFASLENAQISKNDVTEAFKTNVEAAIEAYLIIERAAKAEYEKNKQVN